jgi:hypothetical protein
MTLQISTNTAAARASYNLGRNNSMLQRSFDRLSSGKKTSFPNPGSWKPCCFDETLCRD